MVSMTKISSAILGCALFGLAACDPGTTEDEDQAIDSQRLTDLANGTGGKQDGAEDCFDEGSNCRDYFGDRWRSEKRWCGWQGTGTTRRELAMLNKGAYEEGMLTSDLSKKIRISLTSPKAAERVVAIEASLRVKPCMKVKEGTETCEVWGAPTWQPYKVKVGHGSAELDLNCLGTEPGFAKVLKVGGAQLWKIRFEQGFDGSYDLFSSGYKVETTCDWNPKNTPADYCSSRYEDPVPVTCDGASKSITDRYSSFVSSVDLMRTVNLVGPMWAGAQAQNVGISVSMRMRKCDKVDAEGRVPCLRYGQATWVPIGEATDSDGNVTFDMADAAFGLGNVETYSDPSAPAYLFTFTTDEPNRFQISATGCPKG